jgi:ornithine--oxo-acid transaminase
LKICRKWGYEVKGIPENQAQIIVCENNFHGRTTTIISFSNDENARKILDLLQKALSKLLMMIRMP